MTITALRPILAVAGVGAGFLSAIAGLALGALAASPAFAQGTPQQRAACTPDVMRLCASEIPNVDRIIACMRRERAQVSASCQAAMWPAGSKVEVAANTSPRQAVR